MTMIGSDGRLSRPGDGVPHPRNYGTFPRVLGEYVRVQHVLTLEQAVHKMTGMSARGSDCVIAAACALGASRTSRCSIRRRSRTRGRSPSRISIRRDRLGVRERRARGRRGKIHGRATRASGAACSGASIGSARSLEASVAIPIVFIGIGL